MTTEQFPTLDTETLAAINRLSLWLAAAADCRAPDTANSEVIVIAGNGVIPVIDTACRLAASCDLPVVISGGIGHSTAFLYRAVGDHQTYRVIPVDGRPESVIIADIARQFYGIPERRLYCETASTNCGENAHFTRQTLRASGLDPQRGILIQDPTMQRRTAATFARAWRGEAHPPRWINFPGIVPQLENHAQGAGFKDPQPGLWPVDRWLSLLMGEIPRLRDTPQGYGPAGRDFIEHVDIPGEVEAAWQHLADDKQLTAILNARSLGQ